MQEGATSANNPACSECNRGRESPAVDLRTASGITGPRVCVRRPWCNAPPPPPGSTNGWIGCQAANRSCGKPKTNFPVVAYRYSRSRDDLNGGSNEAQDRSNRRPQSRHYTKLGPCRVPSRESERRGMKLVTNLSLPRLTSSKST